MKCRHCKTELELEFLDLGNAPPSNAYLNKEDLRKPEITYPLRILTCTNCWLVQTEDYTDADELFNEEKLAKTRIGLLYNDNQPIGFVGKQLRC